MQPDSGHADRRERIKIMHGVDIDDPFEHLVFPDGTVQWQPITIVLSWLALLLAYRCGDIARGEAYRLASDRVGGSARLTHEDWHRIEMAVRASGIRITDEIEKE